MPVIAKAAFARELGISEARVYQYVGRGSPVRSDGKLDREGCVKWIADNHHNRGPEETAGVCRAAEIARTLKVKRPIQPKAETAQDLLVKFAVLVLEEVGPIAAKLAVGMKLPIAAAFALDQEIAANCPTPIEDFLRRHRRVYCDSFSILEELPPENVGKWQALAERAGEPFDVGLWSEQVTGMGQ